MHACMLWLCKAIVSREPLCSTGSIFNFHWCANAKHSINRITRVVLVRSRPFESSCWAVTCYKTVNSLACIVSCWIAYSHPMRASAAVQLVLCTVLRSVAWLHADQCSAQNALWEVMIGRVTQPLMPGSLPTWLRLT